MEKGISVRLTSVSQDLLEGVQRLLLNFGIASCISKNRREAATRDLPDGKGGLTSYNCQAYHELIISRSNLHPFAKQIAFLSLEKQNRLETTLQKYAREPYHDDFLATFESLISDGEE